MDFRFYISYLFQICNKTSVSYEEILIAKFLLYIFQCSVRSRIICALTAYIDYGIFHIISKRYPQTVSALFYFHALHVDSMNGVVGFEFFYAGVPVFLR